MMRPDKTRRILGAAAALSGLWWTVAVVVAAVGGASSAESGTAHSFTWIFELLSVLPGVLAIVFGVRLFRTMRESSLRWVLGTLAVVSGILLASSLSASLPPWLPKPVQDMALIFIASLTALGVYLVVLRSLLRHHGQDTVALRSLLGRGQLKMLALLVWLILQLCFEEYIQVEQDADTVLDKPWWILGQVIPIAVAYGLYRVAVMALIRPNVSTATQSHCPVGGAGSHTPMSRHASDQRART